MTRRRAGLGALATALVLMLAACAPTGVAGAGGAPTPTGETIALLLPESKTARYEGVDRPTFEEVVERRCPSCRVLYANADQDAARQQEQAESVLTQGAGVLVLDAVDVKAAAGIVARAKQSNVPVVSYGRLVSNADLDYYVSIDPFKVGQQQAQVLLDALDKQGKSNANVVMINGSPTDSNSAPYKKGAHSILVGKVKILKEYDTADWSPDKAQQEMEQAITAVGKDKIDGVYVANDGMAGGAIAAMKSAGIDPATHPVTGQDAEVTGVQRILEGTQLMTVYQPIPKIAAASAELAVPLAQGKQPPDIAKEKTNNGKEDVPSVLLPTVAITKGNVKDTVVKDGFVKPAELCRGQYAKACADAGIA